MFTFLKKSAGSIRILLFLLLYHFSTSLQANLLPVSNKPGHTTPYGPCNVVAGFTPNNDSILPSNTFSRNIIFTNTSINATSIIWYLNGIIWGHNNTLNIFINTAGTYEIKLVAINGTCSDTMVSYIIYAGLQPANRDNIKAFYGFPAIDDNSNALISTFDGGYLIGGETQLRGQQEHTLHYHGSDGFLQKIDESGCIKWTKILESTFSGSIFKILQLKDSNYAVLGQIDNIGYLRKFDRKGNMIWNKNFITGPVFLHMTIAAETEDGGFVLAGKAKLSDGIEVLRTDEYGNILWNKFYAFANEYGVNHGVLGILQKGNAVYISGYVDWVKIFPDATIFSNNTVIKLNDVNGQTQWTKTYTINGQYCLVNEILSVNNNILLNCTNVAAGVQNNFIELDTDGNIQGSKGLSVQGVSAGSASGSMAIVRDNGDIYVLNTGTETLNLQPYYAYNSTFITLDKNYVPKLTKNYSSYERGRFFYPAIGKNGIFAAAGDEGGSTLAPYSSISDKIQFTKIDPETNDPLYYCNFYNHTTDIINTLASVQSFSWTTDSTKKLGVKDSGSQVISTVYSEVRFKCPLEFIDSCSLIKISGPAAICNLASTYTYRLHKNKACNELVNWQVNLPAKIITKTDSTIIVKFPTFGKYYITAYCPFTCSPVKDSILISAALKSPVLNIGADTTICDGNKLQLNAGDGFFTYKWQDGSADKSITASLPGIYWVQVTDSCDNIFTDSIMVTLSKAFKVNAGPDKVKCNNDTLQLAAPAGFISYAWSPDYNISNTSLPNVIINPVIDTNYFLKAEISQGCFAYDTIHIKVNLSPPINLGADTSICAGNTLSLNTGAGFAQYLWNTGANTQQIIINLAGNYTVKATAANGCFSTDTLQLLAVHPLPVILLDTSTAICAGIQRVLDAGAGFMSYLWNNGSTLRSLTINTTGDYAVTVTDNNYCRATAAVKINKILPVPANFLPADTSICIYETISVSSLLPASYYLWSNNTLGPNATNLSPGIYWLRLTDYNNCTGTDTIIINKRNCMQGIFVPAAFSPNGDGKNDIFKPLLFGNIASYHFIIFNRFGQTVFESTELNKGWDGIINGIVQNGNTFVWICIYQFYDQAKNTKKGTVIVVK